MALMDLEFRSATARAVDDCLAIRIPRDALDGLYARDGV
jgi:CRP-like cAMP-binding protein